MILKDSQETRNQAAQIVAAGGVIAYRTDTFYGLGADPFNPAALRRINELKGRDGKPILVLISDEGILVRFISERSSLFDELRRRHWPGPLTIVVKAALDVPEELTAGSGTVGLRLPNDGSVRDLVKTCGGALTATSANRAEQPPAKSANEVAAQFSVGLDLIIDGGTAAGDKPSTVVDVSKARPQVIREGAISRGELEHTFGQSM